MISPIKPRRCAVLSDSRLTDRINRRQVFRGTDKPAESLTHRRLYSECVIPVFEDGEIAEMGQFLYDNHNDPTTFREREERVIPSPVTLPYSFNQDELERLPAFSIAVGILG